MLGNATPAQAAVCENARATSADASLAELSDALVCLINRERRSRGIGVLWVGRRLEIAAWRHARDMRDNDYFSHTSRDGRDFSARITEARYTEGREAGGFKLGETLAWAHEAHSAPASILGAFMDSPPHRRVILDGEYEELGIGIVRGTPTKDASGLTVTIDYGSLESGGDLRRSPARETSGSGSPPPGHGEAAARDVRKTATEKQKRKSQAEPRPAAPAPTPTPGSSETPAPAQPAAEETPTGPEQDQDKSADKGQKKDREKGDGNGKGRGGGL